jgi:hypothetical protein
MQTPYQAPGVHYGDFVISEAEKHCRTDSYRIAIPLVVAVWYYMRYRQQGVRRMPNNTPDAEYEPKATDILTVTQFANVFPMDAVTQTLDSFGCGTIRVRDVTNERLVYFQIMLSLFRECSFRAVYRTVAAALDRLEMKEEEARIPSAAALVQGLDRLKPEVFESLFHEFAIPLGKSGEKGIYFKQWKTFSIDGFTLATENTKANRKHFGAPSNQHQSASLPQLRCVCFVETGSHLITKAAQGGYHDGEISLARKLLPYAKKDWLLLADRNFYSWEFYRDISDSGAKVLFRLQKGMALNSEKELSDGSHLVTIHASSDRRKENGLKARVIQYVVLGTKKKTRETYYLLTNILDPELASAEELARLYKERWEHENTLDELKTHLNLSAITLRSKNPERVVQEFWGILMAHYALRSLMHKAAVHGGIDPDRLSFTHTVNVVKDRLTMERNAHCDECGKTKKTTPGEIIEEVLEERLPDRRARSRPRGVCRRKKYEPVKLKDKKTKKVEPRIKVKKPWSYRVPR